MKRSRNAYRVGRAEAVVLANAALAQVKGGGDPAPPDSDPPPGSGDSNGSGTGP